MNVPFSLAVLRQSKFVVFLCAAVIALSPVGCGGRRPPPGDAPRAVTVYAAASTRDAVDRIARDFTAKTGVAVEVAPGASSRLAKQIVEGGPADLFLSADQANADYLVEKNLVAARRNLLGNRLVVVVPADSSLTVRKLADLAGVGQLALALEKVPAGEYAREALAAAGVWEGLKAKVVGGEDVRATLTFVEKGVEAGIVYATDPIGHAKVRVALEVDPSLHRPIEYPLVLVARTQTHPDARRFFDHLSWDEAAVAFRAAGFAVLATDSK